MKLVNQAQDLTNYIEALEYQNENLRNALFRILEKGDVILPRIEYSPSDSLDFTFDTNGVELVIRKVDCNEWGVISPQDRIKKLKSKI